MALIKIVNERLSLSVNAAVGASITDFSLQGPRGEFVPLMRRSAEGEVKSSNMASFTMAPWVNRIAGGAFTFLGRDYQLRITKPEENVAMHGDVRDRAWTILDRSPISARLEFDSRAADAREAVKVNYPFPFVAQVRYEVQPSSLIVDLDVRNVGTVPMPAGCGLHPYFMRRLWDARDVVEFEAHVATRYPVKKSLPIGPAHADELTKRLATMQPFPAEPLDDVFSGRTGDVVLRWPASGVTLTMKPTANLGHLVVFTPPHPTEPRPQDFFAVEPQSQVNNALVMAGQGEQGTGTVTLAPGETLATRCEFEVKID